MQEPVVSQSQHGPRQQVGPSGRTARQDAHDGNESNGHDAVLDGSLAAAARALTRAVAAAALQCLGGGIQSRLYPRNDEERQALVDGGYDVSAVLTTDDLCAGTDVFFAATGITNGSLLHGVSYHHDGATTYSMVMRSRSGTVRYIEAHHEWEKLERFAGVSYRPSSGT